MNSYHSRRYWRALTLQSSLNLFLYSCANGDCKMIDDMINQNTTMFDWNKGLIQACENNQHDIAMLLIETAKVDNYQECFEIACTKNYIQIVKSMIGLNEQCRNCNGEIMFYYEEGLYKACRAGHAMVAEYILIHIYSNKQRHVERGLHGACDGGHVETAKLMIVNGAINLDHALFEAFRRKHVKLAKFLYIQNPKPYRSFSFLRFSKEFVISLLEESMPKDCFKIMEIDDPVIEQVFINIKKFQRSIHQQLFLPPVLLQIVSNYSLV